MSTQTLMQLPDLSIYFVPAITGALIGLLILLIFVPLLYFLLRRRKKILSDTRPTIPQKTREDAPPSDVDTEESLPAVGVRDPLTVPVSGQRPGRINWQIAGLTDVGLKRELNEDNLLMAEAETPHGVLGLYAVADGMGGHEKGEIASQLTLDTVHAQFTQSLPTTPYEEWLKTAVIAANEAVMSRQHSDSQDKKMGSTLVMALFTPEIVHIVNVGDSRAYHLSRERIDQLTEDHSLVERLVQIGQLSREEARTHRQKNVIYNTIGDKENLQISLYEATILPDERLLLCSDGLNNMLTDEQILEISLSHASPVDACKELVQAAKTAGGVDNITAIIIQMNPPE